MVRSGEWVCTASSGARLGQSRGTGKCEGGRQQVERSCLRPWGMAGVGGGGLGRSAALVWGGDQHGARDGGRMRVEGPATRRSYDAECRQAG